MVGGIFMAIGGISMVGGIFMAIGGIFLSAVRQGIGGKFYDILLCLRGHLI